MGSKYRQIEKNAKVASLAAMERGDFVGSRTTAEAAAAAAAAAAAYEEAIAAGEAEDAATSTAAAVYKQATADLHVNSAKNAPKSIYGRIKKYFKNRSKKAKENKNAHTKLVEQRIKQFKAMNNIQNAGIKRSRRNNNNNQNGGTRRVKHGKRKVTRRQRGGTYYTRGQLRSARLDEKEAAEWAALVKKECDANEKSEKCAKAKAGQELNREESRERANSWAKAVAKEAEELSRRSKA